MDFTDIRRLVIVAMFSDDTLFDQLTLKGGNALNLIYGFGMRSSLDVDLSLEQDFEDPEDSGKCIFKALSDRFAEVGITVFDYKFGKRPVKENRDSDKWGGYEAEFKSTETDIYDQLKDDMDRVRRESLVIGDGQQRVFRVQQGRQHFLQVSHENLAAFEEDFPEPLLLHFQSFLPAGGRASAGLAINGRGIPAN
ncbi:MAG TPA: nucleotidyl transferase AbiEii/AbiGii toxin family protein [Candidatus Limnocylindrales bacterium]|nr:nucleotidyl transferase AbiEii/AbiGii toxin family protein [Candidatus Limnocylindrales bacterium]